MKARNMLAILILILGSVASFYCYTRLNAILPMSHADAVAKADAVITAVDTPMVKKNETTREVKNGVQFTFAAGDKTFRGSYSLRGLNTAPEIGAKEPVVYLEANPNIFLRQAEYDDLPRQLTALRVMMVVFALAALILPFVVMKRG